MGNRNRSRNKRFNQSERGYDPSSGYRRDREFGESTGFGYRGDQEPYFGSGRQHYGEGYSSEPYRSFTEGGRFGSSYPTDSGYRNSEYGYRGSESGFRGRGGEEGYTSGYERERGPWSYGSGLDSNYPNRSRFSGQTGGMYGSEYEGGSGYGSSSYGRGNYGSGSQSGRGYENYPDSESGYTSRGYNQEERGWWDRTADELSSWFGDEDAARRRERDYREEGQYRGRGPKGYSRSDERIREDINDRLTDFAYLDASNIEVQVEGSEVTLTGTVESRYEKRLAEDLAEAVSGVSNVENRIRVSRSWTGSDTSSTYGGTLGTSATDASNTEATATSSKSRHATSR